MPKTYPVYLNLLPVNMTKTKESQRWRHVLTNIAAERITEITKYLPRLTILLDSLNNYSLCERHYNQIVVKKFRKTERKRPRLSNDNKLLELEKTFSDFGVQVFLPYPIYEVYIKRIQELEDINQQLLSENATLKKQLDEAFNNQQGRIKSITEIAKRERATSAIKYSVARSKMVIDIDNHIINSGCYKKFTNWLESLAIEQSKLPKGFLFLAFDNKQKGQKNYLVGVKTYLLGIYRNPHALSFITGHISLPKER
ncbi:hypothetical protein G9A89_023048 [Geosiphon pyriformis]|nr:hypothetical protein G9A89_023048 [Geosiphon pyriformis]